MVSIPVLVKPTNISGRDKIPTSPQATTAPQMSASAARFRARPMMTSAVTMSANHAVQVTNFHQFRDRRAVR